MAPLIEFTEKNGKSTYVFLPHVKTIAVHPQNANCLPSVDITFIDNTVISIKVTSAISIHDALGMIYDNWPVLRV